MDYAAGKDSLSLKTNIKCKSKMLLKPHVFVLMIVTNTKCTFCVCC